MKQTKIENKEHTLTSNIRLKSVKSNHTHECFIHLEVRSGVCLQANRTCGPNILFQELAVVSMCVCVSVSVCVLCSSAVLVDGLCSDIMIL